MSTCAVAVAVAVADSEHSLLEMGWAPPPSSSSCLFLGVASLKVGFRGEGVALQERPAVTSRLMAFFNGLPDTLDNFGNIWILTSSDPRTRLLVGVAIAFITNMVFGESVRTRRFQCCREQVGVKVKVSVSVRACESVSNWQGLL